MQEFGSWWSAAAVSVSPVVQGLFSFGGAALGGIVAMATTRALLRGNADRERIARIESRRQEEYARIRQDGERFLTLLLDRFHLETERNGECVDWCRRQRHGIVDPVPVWNEPKHLTELKVLELIHLSFLDGATRSVTFVLQEYYALRQDEVAHVQSLPEGGHVERRIEFERRVTEITLRYRDIIEATGRTLRNSLATLAD